jgi:hypothetical protein
VLGFSVLLRDITDRKQAEAEQRRLLAEVRRQERWQATTAEIRLAVLSGEALPITLQLICDRTLDLFNARAAAIVQLDDGAVAAAAGDGLPAGGQALQPVPGGCALSAPRHRPGSRRRPSTCSGLPARAWLMMTSSSRP